MGRNVIIERFTPMVYKTTPIFLYKLMYAEPCFVVRTSRAQILKAQKIYKVVSWKMPCVAGKQSCLKNFKESWILKN